MEVEVRIGREESAGQVQWQRGERWALEVQGQLGMVIGSHTPCIEWLSHSTAKGAEQRPTVHRVSFVSTVWTPSSLAHMAPGSELCKRSFDASGQNQWSRPHGVDLGEGEGGLVSFPHSATRPLTVHSPKAKLELRAKDGQKVLDIQTSLTRPDTESLQWTTRLYS